VVGLKPSFGLVPQWPLGAFGHVAVAGPITRTVRDAALMLSAMAVFDARDPFSLPAQRLDYLAGIEDGVAGMRIGVLQNPGFAAPVDADGSKALAAARECLEDLGAVVEDMAVELPDTSEIFSKIWGAALGRVIHLVPPERRSLLDAGLLGTALRFRDVTALEFLEGEARRVQAAHAMAMQKYDAVICPCVPHAAPLAGEPVGDAVAALWQNWAPWTFLFNLTRQPAISLPMGVNEAGLPVAVQIAAPLYGDAKLLRVARALERAV
jgi:aspartyl-tRNA(Asn)/glutamyl-tRNA(Gln) amidotransferase subunit A